jgi:hypothetical protein
VTAGDTFPDYRRLAVIRYTPIIGKAVTTCHQPDGVAFAFQPGVPEKRFFSQVSAFGILHGATTHLARHSSMSSLAELPLLVGFFSYSRENDEDSGGWLSELRERIQAELRGQLGRTKRDLRLWQDKVSIAQGELWEERIKSAIAESAFFIPIITPTAVRSRHCKFEFEAFLAREKEVGRSNLVFPIIYITVPALTDDDQFRQDPLLSIIGSRQYAEWQHLRHLDASSTEVRREVGRFCANISSTLQQPWLSPEERQEAETRQRDQSKRQREEVENKRRLDEAQAETRRRDEEWRKLDKEAKLAAKNSERQKQSEQAPQPQVKRWLLPQQALPWVRPLIGAGGAFLMTSLVTFLVTGEHFFVAASVPSALYGGAAGMLLQRFSIAKALAIPLFPVILLIFVLIAFNSDKLMGVQQATTEVASTGSITEAVCRNDDVLKQVREIAKIDFNANLQYQGVKKSVCSVSLTDRANRPVITYAVTGKPGQYKVSLPP